MAYTSAYSPFAWADRVVQYPMTFTQSTAANGGTTLTPNEGTVQTGGTAFTSGRMQQIENGLGSVSQAMVAAQQTKITLDSGAVKYSLSGAQDLFAQILSLGAGVHTFWAAANIAGSQSATQMWGIASLDAGNHGWVQYTNSDGQTFSNSLLSGVWKGVQRIAQSNGLGQILYLNAGEYNLQTQTGSAFKMAASANPNEGVFEYSTVRLRFSVYGTPAAGTYSGLTVSDTSGAFMNVHAAGFLTTSTEKIKTNIKALPDLSLAVVNATKVYEYDLINALEKGDKFSKKVGLIFEETPESIHGGADEIDLYSMISTLWKATQELSAKNDALEARLLKLEKKV